MRILCFVSTILLITCAVTRGAGSTDIKETDQSCGDHLEWSFEGEKLTILGTGAMLDYDVEDLAPWNMHKDSIVYVDIEYGATSIGNYAFYGLTKLHTAKIPMSVASIGNHAFDRCGALISVSGSENVTFIGNHAFNECSWLNSITIPGTSAYIGEYAFNNCSALKGIDVLTGKTVIEKGAFYQCKSIQKLTIVEGNVTVGNSAFFGCDGLKQISFSSSVVSVGDSAFKVCNGLQSFAIVGSNVTLNNYSFFNCDQLQTMNVSESVVRIGSYAFEKCNSLYCLSVFRSTFATGSSSFINLDGLNNIFFSESNISIGYTSFQNCDGLNNVSIIGGSATIGDFAFSGSEFLRSVTIHDCEASIGKNAFSYCSSLMVVDFSDGIIEMGENVFYNCDHLECITIPDSVISIQDNIFDGCSLTSVFYQGTDDFPSLSLDSYSGIRALCVSPNYTKASFGNRNVSSDHALCKEFQSLFNPCYKASYIDGNFIQQEKRDFKQCNSQSSFCERCTCDNSTGELGKINKCYERGGCYIGSCNESNGECVYKKNDRWGELKEQEDHCYEVVCDGDDWILQKRQNATEWERKTTECVIFSCINDTGGTSWSNCKSSGDISRMCINDTCVENPGSLSNTPSIEFSLGDGVNASEVDEDEITDIIRHRCDIDPDEISIGWVLDEQGLVVRVIVFVSEEQTAERIASVFGECAENDTKNSEV